MKLDLKTKGSVYFSCVGKVLRVKKQKMGLSFIENRQRSASSKSRHITDLCCLVRYFVTSKEAQPAGSAQPT